MVIIGLILTGALYYVFHEGVIPLPDFVQNLKMSRTAEQPVLPAADTKPDIPVNPPASAPETISPVRREIQLEILNGCGAKGVADQLTRLLRKQKYDIVNKGNYLKKGKVYWNVAETRIIDQIGNVDNARELADIMGVLYSNVESYENPSPIADITIIIGKDYKTLPIFNTREPK
ncbi:MAG: LytR family transcriptional regulator [Calditrichaeota bacterium]|nr:MAG: LytR family transcriptional regulator [Calditrichota bacterium]